MWPLTRRRFAAADWISESDKTLAVAGCMWRGCCAAAVRWTNERTNIHRKTDGRTDGQENIEFIHNVVVGVVASWKTRIDRSEKVGQEMRYTLLRSATTKMTRDAIRGGEGGKEEEDVELRG